MNYISFLCCPKSKLSLLSFTGNTPITSACPSPSLTPSHMPASTQGNLTFGPRSWVARVLRGRFHRLLVLALVHRAWLLIKRHQIIALHWRSRHTAEQAPLGIQRRGLFGELHMAPHKLVFPRTLNPRFRVHLVECNVQVNKKLGLQLKLLDHLDNSVVRVQHPPGCCTAPLTTHAGFVAGHVRNVDWLTNRSGVWLHIAQRQEPVLFLKSSHGSADMCAGAASNTIIQFVCCSMDISIVFTRSWIAHPLSDLATGMREPQPSEHRSTLSVFPFTFALFSPMCKIGLQAHCTVTVMTSCDLSTLTRLGYFSEFNYFPLS